KPHAVSKALTSDTSTSTCSPISTRRDESSKNGGSTTTQYDRARASTGSHRPSSQHAPVWGITGTDSPYERGHIGEQVTTPLFASSLWFFASRMTVDGKNFS